MANALDKLREAQGLVALAERLDRNAKSHHERSDAYLSLNNARAATYALVRDYGEFLQAAAESHARALIGASEKEQQA